VRQRLAVAARLSVSDDRAAALIGKHDPNLLAALKAGDGDAARRIAHHMGAADAHALGLAERMARVAEIRSEMPPAMARTVVIARRMAITEAKLDRLSSRLATCRCGRCKGAHAAGDKGSAEHDGFDHFLEHDCLSTRKFLTEDRRPMRPKVRLGGGV
jgi:hypothetical protein